MSGNESGSEQSSKSERSTLAILKTRGGVIAKKVISSPAPDYDKMRTKELLKAALLERDTELRTLAMDHNAQSDRIRALRSTISSKNMEIAQLKRTNKEANNRTNQLADALLAANKSHGTMPIAPQNEAVAEVKTQIEGPKPGTSSNNGTETVPEPRSYSDDPKYQAAIQNLDLENLDMKHEAGAMTPADDITAADGEKFRYSVPAHLLGFIVGRQKVTIRRISNQTSTEIEQCSWSVGDGADAERQMGFAIQGSVSSIKDAITAMIAVVADMEVDKASSLIKGHLKKKPANGDRKPKKIPGTTKKPATTKQSAGNKSGSKFKKGPICPHYVKGHCKYGIKCWHKHSLGLSH